jgi:hypothetical protein
MKEHKRILHRLFSLLALILASFVFLPSILPPVQAAGEQLDPFNFCSQIPSGSPTYADCQACYSPFDNDGDGDADGANKLYTALGCISVSEQALAGDLIQLLLGVAGGVALLSLIAASAMFTLSQGDTGQVKNAKELMTASVSGICFIIFSVIILDFVGVQVLRIPGLG